MISMRRKTLTVGLLMIIVAVLLFEQGTQLLTPLAGLTGLSSHYTTETVILPPTLYSVPASNYSFVSEDLHSGSQVVGLLQVAEGLEVAFYVMNEGNFSLWRTGHPSALVLAEPLAVSYNFTLSPTVTGTYYFVFANQDNNPRTIIFSLNSIQTVTVLSPLLQYASFELLFLGAVFSFLGLRGGKKKAKPSPVVESGWKCKYCGTLNKEDHVFCVECDRSKS